MAKSPRNDQPADARVQGSSPNSSALRFDDEGKARHLTVSWGQAWRLEHLQSDRTVLFPQRLPFHYKPSAPLARPLLVLAEEGSGFTSFRNWVRRETDRFLEVDLETAGRLKDDEVEAYMVGQLLQSSDASEIPADFVQAVRAACGSDQPSPLVCLLHIERVDRRVGGRLLAQLRGAYESTDPARSLNGVQLILLGRDEAAFEIEPYSAIQSIVDTCRLPRFTQEELGLLLNRAAKIDLQDDARSAAAMALHRFCGGQPLLTQLLLQRLDPIAEAPSEPVLEQAYRHVRDNPPLVVRSWQTRLARMIGRDGVIREYALELARGRVLAASDAPQATRTLSIAGWMSPAGTKDAPVWRFSKLHRHWAKEVLRRPRHFEQDPRGAR